MSFELMTTSELTASVAQDPEATARELELVDRLERAFCEIDMLVESLARYRIEEDSDDT